MTLQRPSALLPLLSLTLALWGCDTGTRHELGKAKAASVTSSTTGATTSAPTSASAPLTPALALAPAPLAAPATQRSGQGGVIALTFALATGAQDVELHQLEVASSGTVDESTLGGAEWIEDSNDNGLVDAGEPVLASAGAVSADDAPYRFVPATPLAIAAGQTKSFLIRIDTSALSQLDQVKLAGKTLELSITDAAQIDAVDAQSQASTPAGGTFPFAGKTTLEFGEHVLISEIVPSPGSGSTSAEYVELVNPTAQAIDLQTYYLTDYSDHPLQGRFYWKLPRGVDFGPAAADTSYDFVVRFPAGAQLQPGQVITVAVDAGGYKAAYNADADYCLRNAGATSSVQMLAWDGAPGRVDFSAAAVHDNVGLSNGGEWVCLFAWDGTSDLIQDVDLVSYGNSSQTNTAIDKSPNQNAPGAPDVRIDSLFDQDNVASTFLPDSDELFQFNHRAPTGASIARVDFSEGQEAKTGGNGLTGNDETSEDFGDGQGGNGTFEVQPAATPGTL